MGTFDHHMWRRRQRHLDNIEDLCRSVPATGMCAECKEVHLCSDLRDHEGRNVCKDCKEELTQ